MNDKGIEVGNLVRWTYTARPTYHIPPETLGIIHEVYDEGKYAHVEWLDIDTDNQTRGYNTMYHTIYMEVVE